MAEQFERRVKDPDFGKRDSHREKDALIDQKLFGHEVDWRICGNRQAPYRTGWHDFGMPFSVPYYQSRMEDAWKIVEELRGRGIELSVKSIADLDPKANNCDEIVKLHEQGLKYCVQRWNKENQRYEPAVYGRTAAEAICTVALEPCGHVQCDSEIVCTELRGHKGNHRRSPGYEWGEWERPKKRGGA